MKFQVPDKIPSMLEDVIVRTQEISSVRTEKIFLLTVNDNSSMQNKLGSVK